MPSGSALGESPRTAAATGCHRAWIVDKQLSKGVLTGLAADRTAVWVSGFTGDKVPYEGFVLRRRTGRWSSMAVAESPKALAADAGAAWLVGFGSANSAVLSWDGSRWRRVPAPAVPLQTQSFTDVAARAGAAWFVSDYSREDYTGGWVVAQRRAGRWQVSTGGEKDTSLPYVEAVSASAADDAWVVGKQGGSYASTGELILHWNGSRWSNLSRLSDVYALEDVLALSANDAWAVGWRDPSDGDATNAIRPFAEHWDGSRWKDVSPSGSAWRSEAALSALAAFGPGDVWAVSGLRGEAVGPPRSDALLHWDGKHWQKAPLPPGARFVSALAAERDGTLWAIGWSARGNFVAHARCG